MLFDLGGLDLIGLVLASAFGFIVGQLRRAQKRANGAGETDLKRAHEIVNEFEGIAQQLNQAMQSHQRSVVKFKERLTSAASGRRDQDWADLSAETERILRPTLALADQVARSYDQLKQQSNILLNLQESRIDPLTGVGNRRMFNDTYEAQFALYQRYGTSFALAILDIDHFKEINDTRGHIQGDNALTSLGCLLAELARETDQVARYGGEEFTAILPETDRQGAAEFAERLRDEIENRLSLTVSIGVATTEDFGTSDALLEAADAALYAAKEAGRNRVFYSTADGVVAFAPKKSDQETAESATRLEPV
jgi:diguanylate cyclase (GGDEF)-like protein